MIAASILLLSAPQDYVVYEGQKGPGKGKHIVLLAGDEEYRSEEGLPQLAKILSAHHGFKCTVLFSINPKGEIDPTVKNHQPGMEALDSADLCIMLLRFREWPDSQMKHFVDFYLAGKPIIALRTSTHAFDYSPKSASPYRKYHWRSSEWPGGFGRQVLGETWISHWGNHGSEATRGVANSAQSNHPILRGVRDVFGTSDVYEAAPPPDATILLHGEVLVGMKQADVAADRQKKTVSGIDQPVNRPMMPIAWTREVKNEAGRTNRIFTTTMGAATELTNEALRRLLVNGAYWATKMERKIPTASRVDLVGTYEPTNFGFDLFRRGVKPKDVR